MFSKKPWSALHGSKSSEGADAEQHEESNQSLTTILTTQEDRASLLLLIADCTESMRTNITDAFDPEKTGNLPSLPPRPSASDGSTQEKTPEQKQKEEEDAKEQARKEHERRVKELSAPKIQDLKVAALEYFDDWRDRVLERVGEVLNEKPSTTEQQKMAATSATPQHFPVDQHIDVLSQPDRDSISALRDHYPPRSTPLADLPQAKRILILHSMLLLALGLERYPGESRVLLLQLTSSLGLPLSTLTEDESKVARGLLEAASKQMSAENETKKRAEGNTSRKWKVGLGAAAGATLIGVTGGLAAPFLAAGIGTVMGGIGLGGTVAATYLGALAGSAPLVGILFGAYGGSMTGKVVDQYAKDVQDFAFIPVRKPGLLKDDKDLRRLRVAIGIGGWLTKQEDVVKPWQVLASTTEAFALRWELEVLLKLGNALTTYIKSAAWSIARTEIIKRTVLGALAAGLWPLALVKVSRVIDNPFSVARSRAERVGAVLADALINKVQGERPVTLVGFSLGARAIYYCLMALADRKAFGLIESVALMGAAVPSDSVAWRKMRSVVSGRLVNVYSENDYLLGFLYRTSSLQFGIAGLQAVRDVVGVENVDVSGIVEGHTKYRLLTGTILQKIGFEDVDPAETERQQTALKQEEKKDEEEQETKQTAEDEEEMEREVDKKNKEGMKGWLSDKFSAIRIGSNKDQAHGDQQDQKETKPELPKRPAPSTSEFNTDTHEDEPRPDLPKRPGASTSEFNTDIGPAPAEEKKEEGNIVTTVADNLIPGPSKAPI